MGTENGVDVEDIELLLKRIKQLEDAASDNTLERNLLKREVRVLHLELEEDDRLQNRLDVETMRAEIAEAKVADLQRELAALRKAVA